MTSPGAVAVRVIFMGTPAFAVPSLRALSEAAIVVAVVTQPDRRAGRGLKPTSPPVAAAARALGLPVMQPDSLRGASVQAELSALHPDLLVVAAYGRMIPPAVLALPRLGAINLHPSLLPAYRGPSPIQAAIADGVATTGVTVMYMTEELDAGDIVVQRAVPIGPDETAGELEARLAVIGAELLVEAVRLIAGGEAPRRPQDHSRATYTGKVTKEHGRIPWDRPARDVVNLIRAANPWPCAFTAWRDGILRVWRAGIGSGSGPPGEVLAADEHGITVAAGCGAVVLREVQVAGGRRMPVAEFLRGHRLRPGDRLG
jgi:methionyl-tRNA formyltransferase